MTNDRFFILILRIWLYIQLILPCFSWGHVTDDPVVGIDPFSMPQLENDEPTLAEPEKRLLGSLHLFPSEVSFWGEQLESFNWHEQRHRIDGRLAESAFSPSELLSSFCLSPFISQVDRLWKEAFDYRRMIYAIRSSFWTYSASSNYSSIAHAFNSLRDLNLEPPFYHRYDVVRYPPSHYGPGIFSQKYIDGVIGILVYRGEQHVLTIGLSFTDEGILLNQIQLAQKKGNRWLFSLENQENITYLEYFVKKIVNHFAKHHQIIWLIKGTSAFRAIRNQYPLARDRKELETQKERLQAFYSQPFKTLKRERRTLWAKQESLL